MVITRWKDSKTSYIFSTTTTKGIGQVIRMKGKDSITLKPPKEIITYHQHMGGVDNGEQNSFIGAGFSNVSHCKSGTRTNFWD